MRIEPYNDSEVNKVLSNLLTNPEFINFVKANFSHSKSKFLSLPGSTFLAFQFFKNKVKKINSINAFQDEVKQVLSSVVAKTIDNFSYSGMDNLDSSKPYLFVGNHRDITLDSALCNFALATKGFDTTYNAIGDNLVSINWMGDLLRLNKCFVISRSGSSKKEIYNNLSNASSFIHKTLNESKHVWIAQRQGRTKDGLDKTDPAVLKMIHMNQRKNYPFENISNHINIIPCSISYEIDPLAAEKAKKQLSGIEAKNTDEDVSHIFKGIMTHKGNVHLSFCPQITGEFSPEALAEAIDSSISSNYKLWDTNLYAYDFLHMNEKNSSKYERGKKYFEDLRVSMNNQELEYIMNQYANPVKIIKDLTNER